MFGSGDRVGVGGGGGGGGDLIGDVKLKFAFGCCFVLGGTCTMQFLVLCSSKALHCCAWSGHVPF